MSLESEYQHFIAKVFSGQKISKVQDDSMRNAFFAGAFIGSVSDRNAVRAEVADHVRSLPQRRAEEN